MKVYIDSSVVLRHILSGNKSLGEVSGSDSAGSSDLLSIECHRVLQRERMAAHLDDRQYAASLDVLDGILDTLHLIELGQAVKRRAAGSFPTVIGTLDAIHLSSALLWQESDPGEELIIFSFDRQLLLCARTLGVRVADLL
jgi:hypothetical protein